MKNDYIDIQLIISRLSQLKFGEIKGAYVIFLSGISTSLHTR